MTPQQPTPPSSFVLWTADQVAQILQWNRYTVVKKAEKGELPGFKLGRAWRFRQADVLAWIESKRRGAGGSGTDPA